jgi:hypothetical protein
MRKGILVAVCATALLFLGTTLASAGDITWNILTDTSVAGAGPGADRVIGTADDTTNNCNYTTATGCLAGSTPSIGSFSYTYLDFVQTASCALGDKRGQTCASNADCDDLPCQPCGADTYSFFYKNPGASANRGLGKFVVTNCSSGITYKNMSIGTSEAISGSGGGCLTLQGAGLDDKEGSPCGVGAFTSTVDLTLWVNAFGTCDLAAGNIPDINLDGRVYNAASSAPAGVCGYSAGEVDAIRGVAGNTGYLMIACDSQTLPSPLASVCISGSPFESVIVSHTTQNASDCPDCGGGCVAATADGVE